jgi:hypothetical protein
MSQDAREVFPFELGFENSSIRDFSPKIVRVNETEEEVNTVPKGVDAHSSVPETSPPTIETIPSNQEPLPLEPPAVATAPTPPTLPLPPVPTVATKSPQS